LVTTIITEVHLLAALHVALAVVHPAEGECEDEGDDDNSGDEATHVLFDLLAAGVVRRVATLSSSEQLEGGLGLADGVGELGLGVGFVDPAAGAVVGGLQAFGFSGEEAEGADAEAVGSIPGAEFVVEVVGRTLCLSGVVGAEVLDTGGAAPDAGLDGVAEFRLGSGTFALGA